MKKLITIFIVFGMSHGMNAAEPSYRAKILKIEGQTQSTPQFQFSGPRDKATKPREWIEIEAEVEVETNPRSGYIPVLEASWFAVIIDKNTNKPVRLLGKTVFKDIRTEDGKVILSAYIEPDTLERLTGSTRPSKNDIEGYALTISGPGIVSDGKHAEGLSMATAKKEAKWWIDWKNESLDGLIVEKSKTPFESIWTDRYPTEKADKH